MKQQNADAWNVKRKEGENLPSGEDGPVVGSEVQASEKRQTTRHLFCIENWKIVKWEAINRENLDHLKRQQLREMEMETEMGAKWEETGKLLNHFRSNRLIYLIYLLFDQ